MVENVLLETIKNMRSSGVSDDEIENMLNSMGYSSDQIKLAFSGKVAPVENKTEDKVVEEEKQVSSTTDTKGHADRAELASKMAMNVSEAVSNKVDDATSEVSKLKDEYNSIKDSVDTLAKSEHIVNIDKKTDNLHLKTDDLNSKMEDLDAKVNSLLSIMKKILDSQRDILLKL